MLDTNLNDIYPLYYIMNSTDDHYGTVCHIQAMTGVKPNTRCLSSGKTNRGAPPHLNG